MRAVVGLLDEGTGKLFSLRLVETTLDGIRLLQLLQSEDEQLRIVLVVERSVDNTMSLALHSTLDRETYGNGMGENLRLSSQ